MDEYIREIFFDSNSVPENWVKRFKNPGDPDQFDDPGVSDKDNQPSQVPYENDDAVNSHQQPEADDITDLYLYLNSEVLLPQNGEHIQAAIVVVRATGGDGQLIGE